MEERPKMKSPQVKVAVTKRSLSPCVEGGKRTSPEVQQCATRANIFQNLSVFFACNAPGLAGTGSHVTIGTADDTVLLPILLCDITKRKCSLDKLVGDLGDYCSGKEADDGKGQIFLSAVMKILPNAGGHEGIGEGSFGVLAHLVYHFSGALEDLVSLLCEQYDSDHVSDSDSAHLPQLHLLEKCLEYAQQQEAKTDHPMDYIRFVDQIFSFGESPLIFAARKRNFDIMSLLLRYGGDVTAKWLNFNNVLEVLLFAPSSVYIAADEILATIRCVSLVSTALEGLPVMADLDDKERKGYFAMCPMWRDLLPDHLTLSQAPSLKHISRAVTRRHLQANAALPRGIHTLPIPSILMDYVDLSH